MDNNPLSRHSMRLVDLRFCTQFSIVLCIVFIFVACLNHSCLAQAITPSVNTQQKSNIRKFAPGVHIDWVHRAVEIDAKVVLRKGPLELLVCSPRTREHESILVVSARPLHIFQALGLIGLEPGKPMRYDIPSKKWFPPTGDLITIQIQYEKNSIVYDVPARKWLIDSNSHKPPTSLEWVFAGARTLPSGRFTADIEGTIICVVDFDSALIALNTLHSADNDMLWLQANTEAIPAIDTPCKLIITAKNEKSNTIDIVIAMNGELHIDGLKSTIIEIVARYRRLKAAEGQAMLSIRAMPGVTKNTMTRMIESFVKSGVDRKVIQTTNQHE